MEQVINWAADKPNTVIIVTSDHETGGLSVLQNNGKGSLPNVSWSTTGHTSTPVPVYVWGENSQNISEMIEDNTDIFNSLVITN